MNDKELRELDAWIAEHVMGLKRVYKIAAVNDGEFFVHREDGVFLAIKKQPNRLEYFRPTTDPAAAMSVLKACVRQFPKETMSWLGGLSELTELSICRHAKTLPWQK